MKQQQVMKQLSTAARVFSVDDVEADIVEAVRLRPPPMPVLDAPVNYAPPAVRSPIPSYVEHREGVNEVGKLSAEAMVREFEAAAKEVDAMGNELQDAAKRCEAMVAQAHAAIAECKEMAAAIREKGKLYFLQIEDCTLMTAEVRATCDALKTKIAGQPS